MWRGPSSWDGVGSGGTSGGERGGGSGEGNSVRQDEADLRLLAAAVDGALLPSAAGRVSPEGLDFDAYCRWSKKWPMVQDLLSSLLREVATSDGPAPTSTSQRTAVLSPSTRAALSWSHTPALVGLGRAQPDDLLLQPMSSWMLSACLPPGRGASHVTSVCCLCIAPHQR